MCWHLHCCRWLHTMLEHFWWWNRERQRHWLVSLPRGVSSWSPSIKLCVNSHLIGLLKKGQTKGSILLLSHPSVVCSTFSCNLHVSFMVELVFVLCWAQDKFWSDIWWNVTLLELRKCFSWSSGFTIWATSRMVCLQASLTTWLIMTDYLRKIIVQGRSSKTTKVGDIMTEEVNFASYLWVFPCWLDLQPHGSNVTTVWCFFVISLCFSDHCHESQFQKICIWVWQQSHKEESCHVFC